MSALDLNERLSGLTAEIDEVNEEMRTLTAKRTAALSEQDETVATTIRHQLAELQMRVEDLAFMKMAVEAKLRVYKGNAQKAAEIRKVIQGSLWPQATKVSSKAQQALADLSDVIREMDQLNGSMGRLAAEHETLIGETLPVPALSNVIPHQLRQVVGVRLPNLPETLELKVHSEQVREAQERQEAAFNEKLSKQKTQLLPYLESAQKGWPKCKRCSQELICVGAYVNEKEHAFSLQFCCEVGPHNGARGFIRVEGGPFGKVELTQIELER
jgi:DNA repair exonuclease SbcCD ATPase subunit